MSDRIRERANWIARNVLPHETAIRAWLRRNRIYDLDVDDIVQEMYARIVSLDTFDGIRDPKRYAFQVANSVVVDHIRRARIVSIFSVGNVDELGLAAPDADPEEKATFHDEIREIASAIAALPARTRDVLVLRRVEGLTQRETAKRLAVAEKTVEKHMARGVLMLMNQFGRGGKAAVRTSKSARRVRYRKMRDGSDTTE
jgi:RNA polymerase sigma factor (sigma-70 family)